MIRVGIAIIFSFAIAISPMYGYNSDNMDVVAFNEEMDRLRKEIEHVGRLRQLYGIYEYVLTSPYGVPTKEHDEHY